jgi:hypothetical protein
LFLWHCLLQENNVQRMNFHPFTTRIESSSKKLRTTPTLVMSLLQVLILDTCLYTKQIVVFLIKIFFYQVSQFHLSSIWMMIHPSTYIDHWMCFSFTLFINIGQYKEHKIWAWNFSNYSQFMEFKKKSLEATLKGFFSSLKESSNHPQIKKRKTEVWTPYSILQPM